jgi:hypothetical protein
MPSVLQKGIPDVRLATKTLRYEPRYANSYANRAYAYYKQEMETLS